MVPLHFERKGDGAPVLLLHGLFGSLVNWRGVARVLSERLTVYSLDLRNHGRSPHTSGASYEEMARDVVRFLDERGLERAHVLGHSMGGKVAMEVALESGNRIDRLIVADMAPRAYPALAGPVFAALEELDLANVGSRRQADAALSRRLSDPGLRAFLVMGLETGEGGRLRWRFHLDALLAARDALGRPIDGSRTFPGPTLFVRGERSEYVTEADWPAILRLFPAARMTSVARAGHWLHTEQRDAFCSEVLAFLDSRS